MEVTTSENEHIFSGSLRPSQIATIEANGRSAARMQGQCATGNEECFTPRRQACRAICLHRWKRRVQSAVPRRCLSTQDSCAQQMKDRQSSLSAWHALIRGRRTHERLPDRCRGSSAQHMKATRSSLSAWRALTRGKGTPGRLLRGQNRHMDLPCSWSSMQHIFERLD